MSARKRRKKPAYELQEQENKLSLRCEVKPRTENQVKYVRSIIENEITFCSGPAGSGKSYLAVYLACTSLVKGLVEKVIVTRPMIQCGKGLGFLTGDLSQKFDPYASPIIEAMNEILGNALFNHLTANKIIEIIPLELCRGKNFHKTFVIADEMQNATYQQLVMLLSRHGQQSKTVITGDPRQTDLQFNDFCTVLEKLDGCEGIGIAKLERKDIQRSGIIARILERLED